MSNLSLINSTASASVYRTVEFSGASLLANKSRPLEITTNTIKN